MAQSIRRAELASRILAAIRMWPTSLLDGSDAAECTSLAVSCLELRRSVEKPAAAHPGGAGAQSACLEINHVRYVKRLPF